MVSADLKGSQDVLVDLLSGIDVVISAIFFGSLEDEIPLADAAKRAGVKRFVQSAFMVVIPPRGVVDFREKASVDETWGLGSTLFANTACRRKIFLTTSRSFAFRTHISMLAGGISLPCLDFHQAAWTTPCPCNLQRRDSVWTGMFRVHWPISGTLGDTLPGSLQTHAH